PVSQYDAGLGLYFERQQGSHLGLRKPADIRLAIVCVANRLLRKARDGFSDFGRGKLEAFWIPVVELAAVAPDGVHAVALEFEQHGGDGGRRLQVMLKQPLLARLDNFHLRYGGSCDDEWLLETESQPELNLPRDVRLAVVAQDLPEVCRCGVKHGIVRENRMIEQIEDFRAELRAHPFAYGSRL